MPPKCILYKYHVTNIYTVPNIPKVFHNMLDKIFQIIISTRIYLDKNC